MFHLRKVEIFGFKSFAERTSIVFPGTGIAAVVGPNGCGKSNIADAILWVLGEQSAKTLRGGRMADCIFNGTAHRPPTNLAEVSLTLVDPERLNPSSTDSPESAASDAAVSDSPQPTEEPPAQAAEAEPASSEDSKPTEKKRTNRLHLKLLPGEVVVTRRLYRDGTSQYYLNGEYCRLRDIQELFMGTGLGPESYAIIEQGRIERILSSRPADRRALLEEAAGVTKYKTKRRLAEAKLQSAQQNLLRVNDILEEVAKQLNSLKRQAARARRYQALKTEQTELRRVLLATGLDRLRWEETALAQKLKANTATVTEAAAGLAELEQQQETDQTRQYELETLLRQEQNRAGELLLELERAQTRLTDARRQQEELRQRLAGMESEQQTLAEEAARTATEAERSRDHGVALEAELAVLQEEGQRLNQTVEMLREQLLALEAELPILQQQRTVYADTLNAVRTELAQLKQFAETSAQSIHRFGAERTRIQQEEQALAAEENGCRVALERTQAEQKQARESLASVEEELARCQQECQAEQQRLEGLRESLTTAAAQEQALADLLKHRTAFAEPVRKLLLESPAASQAAVGGGGGSEQAEFRAVGVVADFAEFDPDYAPLLEDYLHDEMEYVVVGTYDAARSGVSLLRQQLSGQATFLVDSFRQNPATPLPEAPRPPHSDALVGPLADHVRINGPLGEEAKQVLPKLARTYLVNSAAAAEELARTYPHFFFLSTDGTCYHGRLVRGGARNGHGAHSLQRELQQATRERTEVEPRTRSAESTLAEQQERRRKLESNRDAARQTLFAREKELFQLEQQLDALAQQRARLQKEEARLAAECVASENQRRNSSTRLGELQEQATAAEEQLARLEETFQHLTTEARAAREQAEQAAAQLAQLRTRQAALEERLTAVRAEQARLQEATQRLATAQQEQQETEAHLRTRQTELVQEIEHLTQAVEQRRQEKQAQEARCQERDAERNQLRQRLQEREATVRTQRTQLETAREQRHALEVNQARQQAEREHAETSVQTEFGLTGEDLCLQTNYRLIGAALAEAETRDREIKYKLENIGPINMMALEEFQQCEQRHGFLLKQRDDLLASIEDTRRAISEIDEVSRQRFNQAFAVINQNFAETFRTLFGGGAATLRLTDEESPGDSGVDLICQPPGKRLQNVLLLSGGEKALTALALLIAIFRYSPSPFCILDEVDAPLDDTNIGRFTRLLVEMAAQTQFILITHSKKTMEVASLLYGVTMQRAVSQIVSVRFDQAA